MVALREAIILLIVLSPPVLKVLTEACVTFASLRIESALLWRPLSFFLGVTAEGVGVTGVLEPKVSADCTTAQTLWFILLFETESPVVA